jgi:uncharacterized protein YcbK (DUF882 family)
MFGRKIVYGSPPGRRRFLFQAATLCTAAASLPSFRALAADDPAALDLVTQSAGRKVLRFVHTHTGETLTAAYCEGGVYDAACLDAVNHLLRDFRSGETHVIDPALLDLLHDLQVSADCDAPYEVISGYRSPSTNAMLRSRSAGVAERSQHLLGKAIDVRLSGFSTKALGEHARGLARGGVGFYARSDFVHVDTGRVRFW